MKELKNIIKKKNVNKDIKWNIEKGEENVLLKISNDYCDGVQYTVIKELDEEIDLEGIIIRHKGVTICYLIKGDDRWSDYTNDNEALKLAVKIVVRHFYHYY